MLCLVGWAVKWLNTRLNAEQIGERVIKKYENEMNITTMFSVQPELSVCGIYPFLPILLAIVALSI